MTTTTNATISIIKNSMFYVPKGKSPIYKMIMLTLRFRENVMNDK